MILIMQFKFRATIEMKTLLNFTLDLENLNVSFFNFDNSYDRLRGCNRREMIRVYKTYFN